MYLHIVMMSFHQAVTPALREQIQAFFQSVRDQCEGMVRFDLVDNQSRTSVAFSHALLSVFSSVKYLDAYRTSVAHASLMDLLGPLVKQIVVLDTDLVQGDHSELVRVAASA
jgi:hypothetical protein